MNFAFTKKLIGQEIQYVCYGEDPTYTQVKRPQFLIVTAKVTAVGKNGKTFATECERGYRHDTSHFADRTVMKGDQAGLDMIIAAMAEKYALKFEAWSDRSYWKAGAITDRELEKFKKVAEQYRSKDYEIVLN